MQHSRWCAGALGIAILGLQAGARADDDHEDEGYGENIAFIEALGGYGLQIGETDYLPAGDAGDYQHPMVHGFSVGGTAGIMLDPAVALIASYEYSNARSVEGGVTGVLDRVQGYIEYHTAVVGIRLYHPVGFGRLRAEVGGGVVFPYQTLVEYDYGPGLQQLPVPITGMGSRVDNYSVGFGGQAALGWDFPIVGGLYFTTQLRLKLFEAENSGETTELRNFVTDFGATPPTATDAEIRYGDGGARPSTNSVQEARLQVGLGWGF